MGQGSFTEDFKSNAIKKFTELLHFAADGSNDLMSRIE